MADKKLLEEATIRRFMQLANIKASEKGVLSESMNGEVAGGRSATPTRGTSGKVQTAGQTGPIREKKKKVPADEEKMEEGWDAKEETVEEADDMEMPMDEEMPADDMGAGGDEAGAEGGELESAVEDVVAALNKVFAAAGLDKEVEVDSGSEGGEDMAPPADDMGMEDEGGAPMMEEQEEEAVEEAKEKDEDEEELEESVELVDDALIEKLVKRVSDRLVAEARKAKEQKLAEAKKGGSGNWLSKPAHSKPPKGHGAGKSKKSTPFSKSVSVKGTAGRGR